MQLEAFSPNNNWAQPNNNWAQPIVEQLLPFVKPFAYSWFNLSIQKRKYHKKYDHPMPLEDIRAAKVGLKATPPLVKKIWAERLLGKLLKDVVVNSRDDFARCIMTANANTSCVPSQPDHQKKMRRIDCFKQADKIWRLDIVAVIVFKGVPLENTDSERMGRVRMCCNKLCINPYHVLINCKELDLYTSYHIGRPLIRNKDIVLASVHSVAELLGEVNDDDDDDDDASDIDEEIRFMNYSKPPPSATVGNLQKGSESETKDGKSVQEKRQQILDAIGKLLPKDFPRFVASQSSQQNRKPVEDVRPVEASRTTFKKDPILQRPQLKDRATNVDSHISQLLQIDKDETFAERPELGATQNVDNLVQQQSICTQALNQGHCVPIMHLPLSNVGMNFSQVIPQSTIIARSSLTFTGPLFVIRPINSETVFTASNSGTLLPITHVVTSAPQSKPPQQLQFTIEQLGISNFTKLAPCPTTTTSSSTFNFEQFFDFGQQQHSTVSSSSPPRSLSISTSIQTSNPPLTSTTSIIAKTISKKPTKRHQEPSSLAPRLKRQRRATVTGISDESLGIPEKPNFMSEASLSETQVSKLSSENFLRSDRREGFRLFQSSSGVDLPSSLRMNFSNSSGTEVEKPGIKLETGNRQSFAIDQSCQSCVIDQSCQSFAIVQSCQPCAIDQSCATSSAVKINFSGSRESPASDRGSPMPHIFTKELLLSSQNLSKPVAIFSPGNHLAPINSSQVPEIAADGGNDDDDDDDDDSDDDCKKLKICLSNNDDDDDDDKDSNLAFNGRQTYQASPFTLIPITGVNNKQVMVGYSSNVNSGGNNSNPVLCCFNAGGLLSPTPPFNLPSSPITTPVTTPCSTPVPPRWCTPLFLEGDSETYPALMVNFINLDEICFSSESSGASSDKRSQTSSNPNFLTLSQRMIQEGANNNNNNNNNNDDGDDDDDDDDGDENSKDNMVDGNILNEN